MNTTDLENSLIIFTDGSSLGNPGPGGWGGMLLYPKLDEAIELGGTKAPTTNNEMELTAILSALTYAADSTAQINLFTDSQYAINGVTKWMYGWAKNGWLTKDKEPIKNKDIWQRLFEIISKRGKDTIAWHHVRGHVGVPANERVDDIARELAEGVNVKMYRGKLSEHPTKNLLHIDLEAAAAKGKEKSKTKSGKAYSYVALVEGKIEKFSNWDDCKARVHGRSSKYKKALSAEHEKEILTDWGVSEK